MKPRCLTSLLLFTTVTALHAGDPQPLDLTKLTLGPGVTLKQEGDETILRIDRSQAAEKASILLFNLEKPGVTKNSYALLGEVRYENMPAGSFLETWNHFPAEKDGAEIGASYFSRTLGESGPMGKLSENSDWRPFHLPFIMNDQSERRPLRVTFNAQFAGGGGVIEIRNLRWMDGLGEEAAVPAPGGEPQKNQVALAFAGGLALAAVSGIAIWRAARARTQRELRRIQAADA